MSDSKIPIKEQTLIRLGVFLHNLKNFLKEDAKYTKKDSSIRTVLTVINEIQEQLYEEVKESKKLNEP